MPPATRMTIGWPSQSALAARYELPFEQPDWIGDVIERYGLKPPV